MTRLTAIFAFGLTVAGLSLGGTAVAQTSAGQTITPPSLQGSFLSPEAPQAPKLDIDPATLGVAPRVEAAAPVTASAEEKAAAAKKARKIALYKQLMEENGTSKNVRLILANTKAAVRLVVLERKGAKSLSAADEIKFNEISTRVLKDAENNIINQIASAQSAGFSEEEILTLISANSNPSAVRYNASKFANPDANAQQIQAYMVDAVVKIIKSFKESISG
ncbi:MAG: hypothetical protein QM667_00340 [Asticcacaulis sp.]